MELNVKGDRYLKMFELYLKCQYLLVSESFVRDWFYLLNSTQHKGGITSHIKSKNELSIFKWNISHPGIHFFCRKFENKARMQVNICV